MTEVSDSKNLEIKKDKKRQSFLTKIVITLALIFFSYLGVNFWQNKQAQKAQLEAAKSENSGGDIFDISDEYKKSPDQNEHELPDLTVNELKEKGAEFIYQMLLKNQVQINDLRDQVQLLKSEILKYKNQEKIGKIIFTYVGLRQDFYEGEPYEAALKNFEMLIVFDGFLPAKAAKLKSLLPNFIEQKALSRNFSNLIPELIAAKTFDPSAGIISKIRYNISKLIVIRKIDENDSGDVDAIIAKTERLLREENYQEALNSLLSLDQSYNQILAEFLNDLGIAVEVQKIDYDILNYLKSLS
jgi:predicted negative regulator of RcsB-dependent stress response